MDLTVAGAYMQVTNKALAKNAQTSVLEYKTKLGEKTLGLIDKQIEDYKKLNKKLEAEGERLKAEGEAIEEQGERDKLHKTSREYYMNRRDTYPLSRKRFGQAVLIKNKLDKKIKKQVSGYIFRKSLNNTPYEVPEVKFETMAITNMLLNKKIDKEPK